MRVLIVDDDPVVRRFAALVLETLAHASTIEVGDGATGLALAASDPPDLIVLDVDMPVMDGLQTLSRLRADAATGWIPVVLFSSRPAPRLALLGAEAVLDKALGPVSLAEAVLGVLDRVRTRTFRKLA